LSGDQINIVKCFTWIIPEKGSFIGWKKLCNGLIAELEIPAKAKRTCNFSSRKCRAEYAKVIAIYNGKKKVKTGISKNNNSFIYTVGKIVRPDKYDHSPLIECSNGIHFFITKQEAINY
jgi:hypothetical protein